MLALGQTSTDWRTHNTNNSYPLQAAQSLVKKVPSRAINQGSFPNHSPRPVSSDQLQSVEVQQKRLTYAQSGISIQAQAVMEAYITGTQLQELENEKKVIKAQNLQAKQGLALYEDLSRASELQRLQEIATEEYSEASTRLLAHQTIPGTGFETTRGSKEASEQQSFIELSRIVKSAPGRLEHAEARMAQKYPAWSHKRVKENALESEVRHEISKIEQTTNRKEQVKILLDIRPDSVERLLLNAPDEAKNDMMREFAAARLVLENEEHITLKWKEGYQFLLRVGKEVQKARQQRMAGSVEDAASAADPSIVQEKPISPSLPQKSHPLDKVPWLSSPRRWRHDPYTHGYLVYSGFTSSEEEVETYRNIQNEETRLYNPRVQIQAYFLDLYNKSTEYHKYYPPASHHTDAHGNVCIGDTTFRSYERNRTEYGGKGDEETEKDNDWLVIGASGYAGMTLKGDKGQEWG